MARLITIGYEFNTTAVSVEFDTVDADHTVQSVIKHSGTYAGHVAAPGSQSNNRTPFASADIQDSLFFRAYIYVAAAPTALATIMNVYTAASAAKISVRLNPDLTLQLWNAEDSAQIGSLSSAISLNTWYRVEFSVNTTTLASTACTARIDGVQFATGNANLSVGVQRFSVGTLASEATLDIYYDCLAVNDDSGTAQNSWPGEGYIIRLLPNAAGDVNTFATQTGGTAGSANNYTRVDELTPDTNTTLNGSNTLNQEDFFNMEDCGLQTYDTITLVEVWVQARNPTADAATELKSEIKKTSGGTIAQSIGMIPNTNTWQANPTTSLGFRSPFVNYLDPDGAAWTSTTLDSMQLGYKITTGGTNRIDVSNISAIVEYVPGVAPSGSPNIHSMMMVT